MSDSVVVYELGSHVVRYDTESGSFFVLKKKVDYLGSPYWARERSREARMEVLNSFVRETGRLGKNGEKYKVVLQEYRSDRKIEVIKTIRQLTGCGLKEAKDASESLPVTLVVGMDLKDAYQAAKKLDGYCKTQVIVMREGDVGVGGVLVSVPVQLVPSIHGSYSLVDSNDKR